MLIITDDDDLKQEEYKDFVENVQLKAIIAGQKAKRLSVKQGDIEIFVRGALPKGIRDRIVKIGKDYEVGDTITADE